MRNSLNHIHRMLSLHRLPYFWIWTAFCYQNRCIFPPISYLILTDLNQSFHSQSHLLKNFVFCWQTWLRQNPKQVCSVTKKIFMNEIVPNVNWENCKKFYRNLSLQWDSVDWGVKNVKQLYYLGHVAFLSWMLQGFLLQAYLFKNLKPFCSNLRVWVFEPWNDE